MAVVVARSTGGGESASEEDHLGPAAPAEPNPVAVGERPLGDLLAVDVGPVAGVTVAEHEMVVLRARFGVIARHFAAGQAEVVGLAPADFELPLRDRYDPPPEGVGHFEAGIGHGGSLMEDPAIAKAQGHRRRRTRTRRTTSAAPAQRPAASLNVSGLAAAWDAWPR